MDKEKLKKAFIKKFSAFGRKNEDKLGNEDKFGYYLPELEDEDIITTLEEIISIIDNADESPKRRKQKIQS